MKKILLYSILAILLSSCAPELMKEMVVKEIAKQLPPLEDTTEVVVYGMGDTVPEQSEILGGVVITQKGDLEAALEIAKQVARTAGGNGLEIQTYLYPLNGSTIQKVSASILNINDDIVPIDPEPFDKVEFNDYIVTKDNDTIPCFIVYETDRFKGIVSFIYSYNRLGYSKTVRVNKSDILSYYIDDPKALAERQKRNGKAIIHQKLFTVQFAADCGLSSNGGEYSYLMAGKVRFQSNYKFTLGLNYDYLTRPGNHFIAGSIGLFGVSMARPRPKTRLEYYLDCGCDKEIEVLVKNRFFFDLFFGYHVDNNFDTTIKGLGIGCALAYDRMISDHLGFGIEISTYPIIQKHYYNVYYNEYHYSIDYLNLNLKAGLRYYL